MTTTQVRCRTGSSEILRKSWRLNFKFAAAQAAQKYISLPISYANLFAAAQAAQKLLLIRVARVLMFAAAQAAQKSEDRKSTRLNSSHVRISYAVFCLKKKKKQNKLKYKQMYKQ